MPQFEWVRKLPSQVPTALPAYQTAGLQVSQKKLLDLANQFKLRPDTRQRPEFTLRENWMISKIGRSTLALNKRSGALRFRNEDHYLKDGEKEFLVKEERAIALARDYVAVVKLVDTPAAKLRVGKVTYLRSQGGSLQGELSPTLVVDAGVIFTREINEIPVLGFGGTAMVNIASSGEVVGASRIWRQLGPEVERVQVLPPSYAEEAFMKRIAARKFEGEIRVLKADFCYFEGGQETVQRFLEPSYAFLYEVRTGELVTKFAEVIPAVKKPRQIWRETDRFPAPAASRQN